MHRELEGLELLFLDFSRVVVILVVGVVALEEDGLKVGGTPGDWRAAAGGELDRRPGEGARVSDHHPHRLWIARLGDPAESPDVEPGEADGLSHLRSAPFPAASHFCSPVVALLIQIIYHLNELGKDEIHAGDEIISSSISASVAAIAAALAARSLARRALPAADIFCLASSEWVLPTFFPFMLSDCFCFLSSE